MAALHSTRNGTAIEGERPQGVRDRRISAITTPLRIMPTRKSARSSEAIPESPRRMVIGHRFVLPPPSSPKHPAVDIRR